MTLRSTLALLATSLGIAAVPAGAGLAQSLKIALSAEPTSADPHYHQMTSNSAFTAHVYGSLVQRNADMTLAPSLATSWRTLDDHTWEFKLRDDVKFSNGQPFTSEDVLFTICRTLNNETNVSQSFMDMTKAVTDVQTPDAHTVIVKTATPFPLMPAEMARALPIIWNGIVEHGKLHFDPKKGCGVTGPWPTLVDFNNGKAAIGTGPYVMKSYVKGSGIELVRNETYWGEKPHWKEVKLVPVPNAGPRLTGLLSGDFDLIENPAARDLPRLKNNPKFSFTSTPSTRLVFFQPDVAGNPSPFVKSANGTNPLQDLRVRRAISMAIDRNTITQRIMDGMATPAFQHMPDGMFGALPKAPEIKYDPEGAKKLLAEAGYPNGFEMTISSPNDRYINDGQISQAVAQYLSRVGIKTNVDAMTASIYFPRRAKREFSFSMGGWPAETGEASAMFQLWVATLDSANSLGTSNYGGYSNPEFDKIFKEALVTIDPVRREKLLQQSSQMAIDELPTIPLHFESSVWAYRKGLSYEGRRDQFTLATSVSPAKD